MPYGCIIADTDGSTFATESVKRAAPQAAGTDAVIHIVGAHRDFTWSETKRARQPMPAGTCDQVCKRASCQVLVGDTASFWTGAGAGVT